MTHMPEDIRRFYEPTSVVSRPGELRALPVLICVALAYIILSFITQYMGGPQ